ncbi:hypothetical protein [Moorena sp. SIO4G3]|uniref:hypothetical protein n=1 Tax=Moorena sp. SIO4G3 TaxID=2607821 RepID=UPI00142C045D|nr:hypothetical protein [Moorena sp. SIO4G3]NEO81404.1 hypothetical protein [Moorena sp. SIO4G3]
MVWVLCAELASAPCKPRGNPRVKALHRSPAPWKPPREGAASLLPTPYSLLPTPYSLLPTPYSLLPTPFAI